jgi:hypothetical protein
MTIALENISPSMPVDYAHWIADLDPQTHRTVEHFLNVVGEDTFKRNWRAYATILRQLDCDFAH